MSIYQKQIESERLNNDVEKWLAQNTIKSLPMGFTHFPDGNVPMKPIKAKESEAERLEKERKIAERNEVLKREKEKQREIRRAEAKKRKQERERAYREKKKAERLAQKEAQKAQLKALIEKHVQPKPKKPRKPTRGRQAQNRILRAVAVAEGAKEFQGDCKHHGMARFIIESNGNSRCFECRKNSIFKQRRSAMNPEQIADADRILRNKARKLEALKQGLPTFIGECRNCGESEFEIMGAGDYWHCRCLPCRRKTNVNSNLKHKVKGVAA